MIIKYDNKIYNFNETPYISIHHNIINFYDNILKKELHFFKNIYISHLLYQKEYNINNDKNKLLNKNTLLNKSINTIHLEINKFEENHLFEILLPYIKVIIISLLIIIRIDIFLSTSFNNHIKSFEDYYILLLYLSVISICIIIPYYSYKVIIRFIQYIIEHLDKDIGMFMSSYIESYNIIDYNKSNIVDDLRCNLLDLESPKKVDKYMDKYTNLLYEEDNKKIFTKEEKES